MSYQDRVAAWISECFAPDVGADTSERSHRFLEEALELVQAGGCTKEDVVAMVDYVYDRPIGELEQEAGGVMVTLAALCSALKISMDAAGEKELQRNWRRIDAIRAKRATKPAGSPLPQPVRFGPHVTSAD